MPTSPTSPWRAGRRACPGRRTPSALGPSERPNVPAGHRPLPVEADVVALIRGAGGTAGAGQLPRRPAERLARPRRANCATAQRIAGPRAARCRTGPASCGWSRPTPSSPISAGRAERLRAILREATPRRRAAANHRHRPRLPRPRLAARRERDPDLPADRRQPADLAHRAAPAGRAAALVGGAVARSSTRRRRRRRPTPCSGTGSPAPCPRALAAAEPCARPSAEEAPAIQADYRLVIDGLGPCVRARSGASAGRCRKFRKTPARRRRRRNRDRCRACGSRRAAR